MKKNLKTKLFSAIAALGLAVASTVGSTYAWFSMNSTVTATGMNVTVSAPTSLLISNTNATTGFGATVALENDANPEDTEFTAVSYAGACTSFYKLTNYAMSKVDETGDIKDFTEVPDGSAITAFDSAQIETNPVYASSTHYYHDTVWLKLEGEEGSDKDVTVVAAYTSEPAEAIKNAMHVVFVVGSNIVGNIDMGSATITKPTVVTLTPNAAAQQVDIYYFLSGNDSDCKNTNITADATMSVNLTFSIPAQN